jgi:hypothetical protein
MFVLVKSSGIIRTEYDREDCFSLLFHALIEGKYLFFHLGRLLYKLMAQFKGEVEKVEIGI